MSTSAELRVRGTVAPALTVLCALLAVGAGVAATVGLLSGGGPGQYAVTSIRGDDVTLYGTGLYRYDTFLIGAGNRGQDAATLFVEVPLLLGALVLSRRGGLRARILLAGVVGYFLYYYASMVSVTAYNRLFTVYVALFSLSLFAFLLAFGAIDAHRVAAEFPTRPSPRVIGGYLWTVAALLTLVWLPLMLPSLFTGEAPEVVATYTTMPTWALDLGVVVPAAVLAAVLLRRGQPLGHLLSVLMLVLNVTIGLMLMSQGVAQLIAGVPLTTGEIVGMVLSFAALTVVAAGLLTAVFRNWNATGLRP